VVSTITQFIEKLHEHDEAWFISSNEIEVHLLPKFNAELVKFHETGKGIFVWADNQPFFYHANQFLQHILPGVKLQGSDPAYTGILKAQPISANNKPPTKGSFARHLVTTGIVSLYEGHTICYPDKILPQMIVIGQSSLDKVCFFSYEPQGKGRVIVDCGFTKIWDQFWGQTAGTERYVRNSAVWLLGLDE